MASCTRSRSSCTVNAVHHVGAHPLCGVLSQRALKLMPRLHDTAVCQTGCQKPVWQPAVSCKQTSNRLSNRLSNGFDNSVEQTAIVHSTGCVTGCQTQFENRVDVCLHDTTGLTTRCIMYRVERTAVLSTGCQTGLYNRFGNWLYTRYSCLSNRLSNRFDNRLNVCIHDTTDCQTGLTTSCIV